MGNKLVYQNFNLKFILKYFNLKTAVLVFMNRDAIIIFANQWHGNKRKGKQKITKECKH